MNRGQILYRVAELMEGRRDQFVAEVAAAEGLTPAARHAPPWTAPSTAGSGTPAGPTRSPRSSARPTRSPRRTSTSRSRNRPASSGSSRPETSSLLGLVSRLAPPLVSGNTVVLVTSRDAAAARRDAERGPRHVRRPRWRRQRPDRPARRSSSRSWPRHEDVDALDAWGVPDALRTGDRARRPRRHQARPAPPHDGRPRLASTGRTTAPPSAPSGSPPSSR